MKPRNEGKGPEGSGPPNFRARVGAQVASLLTIRDLADTEDFTRQQPVFGL